MELVPQGITEPKCMLSEYTYPLLVLNALPPGLIAYILGAGLNVFYRCVSPTSLPTTKNPKEKVLNPVKEKFRISFHWFSRYNWCWQYLE